MTGRFLFAGGGHSGTASPPPPGRGGEEVVAALQARLAVHPDDPMALSRLAVAYVRRGRDTGDPTYIAKASQAVERSLAIDSAPPETMTAAGLVALARHDFAAGLEWGRRASAAQPEAADPLGVMVDAYVELGRYAEALEASQDMVDRRPSLASLARVSYLRELHGDHAGAVAAMTQAITAGAGDAADVASVEALLGDLHLAAGDLPRARQAYRRALERAPGLAPAEVGLARVSAAQGDLGAATARLEAVLRRLPTSTSVALLGDLYAATGRDAEARAQYELVRQIEQLNQANGITIDLEMARFEADHGSVAAVDLARAAFEARPTIHAADALGWALRQTGRPDEALPHARAAVRLGTADALLWYHLAVVEADLGMADEARAHLGRAMSLNPHLTVRDLPAAKALAARLGLLGA